MFDQQGLRWEATNARIGNALILAVAGRHEAAKALAEVALRESAELEAVGSIAEELVVLAEIRTGTDAAGGARLAAAARTIFVRERMTPESPIADALERAERQARGTLGDAFETESAAGRALTVDEAVALALGGG